MQNPKIFASLKTSAKGLSDMEAEKRLQSYGLNQLEVKQKDPWWLKFLRQFTDLMVLVLIGAAVISILVAVVQNETEEMADAYIILGIVLLNAIIGFVQEFKTEKALEALQNLIAPKARVLRNGQEILLDAKQLVPGDLMILAEGDKIGADAYLFEANELKIEESALTGESVPVLKQISAEDYSKTPKQNQKNILYMGTSVASGSAKAVVFATGMQTEFGKIAHMTVSTTKDKSPLEKELFRIGVFVGKVTLGISAILFLVGLFLQGHSLIDSLLFSVAVAVAAVPEGLPATITIALALGVQRLVKKHAIMKQLSSVETLGSTTVICSDKTGTLTKNEMTVTQVLLGTEEKIKVEGIGYKPEGKIIVPEKYNATDFAKLLEISAVCNEAKLVREKQKWKILGDPTEGSLLVMAQKGGFDLQKIKNENNKIFPFDSVRKRMSVLSGQEVFAKGAPDAILELCTHIQIDGKIVKMTKDFQNKIQAHYQKMANEALRVLAIAYRPEIQTEIKKAEDAEKELVFLGLVGMIDPPRPEVKPAVELCHKAGIRTIIITGDFGLTAKAIAQKIDLADENTPVVTGAELNHLKEKELKNLLQKNRKMIFARVAPEHKKRIVNALKELGEIVAVTGDGVNDAPALKRADIGIAMGITGTDVSKEAANMILTDDSFASIVTAVKEGRRIYHNMKKFVWYIFSCNIAELTTIFTAILLGIPAPLTAILILAIDLGTDVFPTIALGIDGQEPGIMEKPPRDPQEHIMQKSFVMHFLFLGLFMGFLVVGIYLFDLMQAGWQWGEDLSDTDILHVHASTMAFATLVMIQLVNGFNARSAKISAFKLKTNWYLWGANLISIVLVGAIVYLPWLREKMHATTLSWQDWILVLGVSLSVFVFEETRKLVSKKADSITPV